MKCLAHVFVSLAVVVWFTFALSGCGSDATVRSGSETSTAGHDHAGGNHDHGNAHSEEQGDMDAMTVALASLSPDDAASAKKQHVCPVSGEMLGTMGAPQKVDVEGQSLWICCDGCEDQLLQNPDEFLAKLPKE